jgi:hypothetical protein
MKYNVLTIFLAIVLFCAIGCHEAIDENNLEQEKAAILEVINSETKAAFNRDYEGWQKKWIHAPYVTKTYMQFPDSSMTETLGWNKIDEFVRTYIEEHPAPAPLPRLVNDIDVRLYGNGAWVSYEQNDAERGLKRETRLMEKVNGQWKIAGMHTTIYGFKTEK